MRYSLIIFSSFLLAITSTAQAFFLETQTLKATSALKIIVIDPGHGGEDSGAVGPSGIKEKDVTLEIAKRLQKLISEKTNAVALLTRTDDKFIPLDERTAIANRNGADLFISIHANASYRKGASGVETYFLSFEAQDEDAKRAADFENAVVSLGNKKQDDKDTDDLTTILLDMAQTEFLNESSHLAEITQENLCRMLKGENRGIKQAPFIVLAGAAMPAVLVEVGFISNAKDERRLTLRQTQEAIAGAIFKSIIKFEGILKTRMGYAFDKDGM